MKQRTSSNNQEETKHEGDMMQDEGSDYLDADEQIEEGQ